MHALIYILLIFKFDWIYIVKFDLYREACGETRCFPSIPRLGVTNNYSDSASIKRRVVVNKCGA